MTIDGKIRNEQLQYDINRAAAKISALFLSKIDKYEYRAGEEILPSDQSQQRMVNLHILLQKRLQKNKQKTNRCLKIFKLLS